AVEIAAEAPEDCRHRVILVNTLATPLGPPMWGEQVCGDCLAALERIGGNAVRDLLFKVVGGETSELRQLCWAYLGPTMESEETAALAQWLHDPIMPEVVRVRCARILVQRGSLDALDELARQQPRDPEIPFRLHWYCLRSLARANDPWAR